MKSSIFTILLFYIVLHGISQSTNDFLIDEFTFSINKTLFEDDNTKNKTGFGAGLYHTFRKDKKINLIFGFEYNKTCQTKNSIYAGHYAHYEDITYTINALKIPLLLRANIGNNITGFVDLGFFGDIVLKVKEKGTYISCTPNENNQLECHTSEVDRKASNFAGNDYGFIAGIGLRIPVRTIELIIKTDFQLGMNKLYDYMDTVENRYVRIVFGLKI